MKAGAAVLTALCSILGLVAAPAAGQQHQDDGVKFQTGPRLTNKCQSPAATGDEIVVCGGREQSEKYRLPIRPSGFNPKGGMESVSRERNRLFEEGDAGIGSCSTIGPGGSSGCSHQQTKRRCQQEKCGIGF